MIIYRLDWSPESDDTFGTGDMTTIGHFSDQTMIPRAKRITLENDPRFQNGRFVVTEITLDEINLQLSPRRFNCEWEDSAP